MHEHDKGGAAEGMIGAYGIVRRRKGQAAQERCKVTDKVFVMEMNKDLSRLTDVKGASTRQVRGNS